MGELLGFDLDRLRLHPGEAGELVSARERHQRPRARCRPQAYIAVPLEWFNRAAQASPRSPAALATGLLLYRAAMMQRTRSPRMPTKSLQEAGISLDARRRALAALERANLVELKARPHRSPRVTVLCPWLEQYLHETGAAARHSARDGGPE